MNETNKKWKRCFSFDYCMINIEYSKTSNVKKKKSIEIVESLTSEQVNRTNSIDWPVPAI